MHCGDEPIIILERYTAMFQIEQAIRTVPGKNASVGPSQMALELLHRRAATLPALFDRCFADRGVSVGIFVQLRPGS
jgi:hypothetical protein